MANEIFIYDEIGPEWMGFVSAPYVLRELDKAGKSSEVVFRVNSPGGSVIEANAIYNAMRRHSENGGKIVVEIDALAASAASFIAMAGDSIRIAENAMIMIHKAWTWFAGNADQMEKEVGVLRKFDDVIADTYAARSKIDRNEVLAKMADETWMTAKDAVALGFADEIGTPMKVAACLKAGRYAKAPAAMLSQDVPRDRERNRQIASLRHQIALTKARMAM